jgi:hypothetical protein
MSIYNLEMLIAQSSSPFVELSTQMDMLIERFRAGEANSRLLYDLIRLNRRLLRERVKVVSSTVLTLFSLYLLTPRTEATNFLQNVVFVGSSLLFALLLLVTFSVWASFTPLLKRPVKA